MKKIISVILCITLICGLGLQGCGNEKTDAGSKG